MAVKAADQITITDITDAYSVILTSESYTFVGGTSGAESGASCTTQAVAYCGSNQCNVVNVNASDIICPTGVTATVANSGTKSPTITLKLTSLLTEACEVTIPVVVDGITVNKKFSIAVAKTGATGQNGSNGKDGKGIKKTEITYQASSSGTAIPSGTWLTNIPSVTAGQYLWTRTLITYTDDTESTSYAVGMMGQNGTNGTNGSNGVGVQKTEVTYQVGTSGTTAPTGTWGTTIPTVDPGKYLWTKTVITYTDGTSSTSYSVGMMGQTGANGKDGAPGANGEDAITVSVTTSNGTVFKNNSGSTILTAHVYKGGVEQTISDAGVVANGIGTVKWYKGTALAATSKTLTVNASQVDNVQAYTCQVEG